MLKTHFHLVFKLAITIAIMLPANVLAQQDDLRGFKPLVDKVWKAQGSWLNGSEFKQEIAVMYDLERAIVVTETKGFIDQDLKEFGKRSHGIRIFNSKTNDFEFWEFDRFGGVTSGTVQFLGPDLYYQYQYGDSVLTDYWEYIDDNTYTFTVGVYVDGTWEKVYLETEFKGEKL